MLALKTAALLAMMIVVFYLTLRAKRFGFERFRSVHRRRKYRVPAPTTSSERPGERDPSEDSAGGQRE